MNAAEVATPLALVVAVLTPPANVPVAPDVGALKVTTTPLTGFEWLSTTVATSGFGNAALTCTLWPEPLVAVMADGAPAVEASDVLVSMKLAAEVAPGAVAVTVYAPMVVPAEKAADVATPLALVIAVVVPFANAPLAPEDGAVKVTVTPAVGVPFVVTVATRGAVNAAPTAALWPDPLVAAIATVVVVVFVLEVLEEPPHPVRKLRVRRTGVTKTIESNLE